MSKPILLIHTEAAFVIGQDTFVESTADNKNAVVFEDNGETGYFYAVDNIDEVQVLDALHIYNVDNIIDKHIPSLMRILWTGDYSKAFLSINDYYHAVFDFKNRAGYCRNNFPENNSGWTLVKQRHLTDNLIESLSKEAI